jgi:predicted permease
VIGVLEGFAIIGVLIAVGWVLGATGVLGPHAQGVLSRFVFFVAAPALLFTVVGTASPALLISPLLAVSALAALASAAVYVLVARLAWHRGLGALTVGALSSGYVNGNNIGLPVALYVLGNAAYTAPVILLQLAVFAPISLVLLDTATRVGGPSVRGTLASSLKNPLILGSVLGLVVALTGIRVPGPVLEPLRLLGGASVPLMLTGFGMALHGVLLASGLKLLAMPAVALALGALVFHLPQVQLHAVVVLAALPTAQNVLNYATRYNIGMVLARDAGLITTIGAVPVLLLVSLLLAA